MQTLSRIKLDGSPDSICLRCLLTISPRTLGKIDYEPELNHVCLPELLVDERRPKTILKPLDVGPGSN
jgi:hypothetical protein